MSNLDLVFERLEALSHEEFMRRYNEAKEKPLTKLLIALEETEDQGELV